MRRGFWRRMRQSRPVMLEPRDAYARWAPAYPPRAHNKLMELEERAVRALLPDVRGLTALDLGCGSGRYAQLLSQGGAARVIGVDQSAEMLDRARAVGRLLVCADARALPLADASIDVVVSGLMMADLADLDAVVASAARVLRPGGCLIYSDLHPRSGRAGWVRAFAGPDGGTYAVRHHVHRLTDHLVACCRARLEPESLAEPPIDFDHPDRGRPAAIVVRARRQV